MLAGDCPPQNPVGPPRPGPWPPPAPPLSCRATVKPVLVLLPVLGLTWLVGLLVHLSPAWAYAAVGLNSLQVPLELWAWWAGQGPGEGVSSLLWLSPRQWGHCRGEGGREGTGSSLQSKSRTSGRILWPIRQLRKLRPRRGWLRCLAP